jgi:hypothetical protein
MNGGPYVIAGPPEFSDQVGADKAAAAGQPDAHVIARSRTISIIGPL